MSNYTDEVIHSSIRALENIAQITTTESYQNTMKHSFYELQQTNCSGNLLTFMEEINELSIEVIKQQHSYPDANMENLIEEWSDTFFGLIYIATGTLSSTDIIFDLESRMKNLFDLNTPFAHFFQMTIFEALAGYPSSEPKEPVTAITELQEVSKAVSKYLRHRITAEQLIPYFQKALIALFILKLYFKIPKENILHWMEKKRLRMEERIHTNDLK